MLEMRRRRGHAKALVLDVDSPPQGSKLWALKRDGGEDKPSVVLNEMVKFEETIKVTYKEEPGRNRSIVSGMLRRRFPRLS